MQEKKKVKITPVKIFQTDWLMKTKIPTATLYQVLFQIVNTLTICGAKQGVPPVYVLCSPGFTWDKIQI